MPKRPNRLPSLIPATPVIIEVNIRGTITIFNKRTNMVPREVMSEYNRLSFTSILAVWKIAPTMMPSVIAMRICQ